MNSSLRKKLLKDMILTRSLELMIAKNYKDKEIRCPVHLSIGQEAISAGVSHAITKKDIIFSAHRSHSHYLSKGGSVKGLIGEIYGKISGCAKGVGGSMHLIDLKAGVYGCVPIVGSTIPISVGAAWSNKILKKDSITVVYFGDGATEQGVFYESLNFAKIHKIPILFICENNFYSVYSSLGARQPKGRENHQLVNAMGIPSEFVDGMNGLAVYTALKVAAARVRETCLPYFIEMSAYRWREHCGPNYDNHIGYRTEEEFNGWRAKDYLAGLERFLLSENVLDQSAIERHENETLREIELAFDRAMLAPSPKSTDFNKFEYRL